MKITALFKSIKDRIKGLFKKKPQQKLEGVKGVPFAPIRKKKSSRWVKHHNKLQAERANKRRKSRKKNRVQKQSRKINR